MTDFPRGVHLFTALDQADQPLTTVQVHYAASRLANLPEPYNHGIAGTYARLDRMLQNGLISSSHNEKGARVWSVPGEAVR
jgi:hypothetical protein